MTSKRNFQLWSYLSEDLHRLRPSLEKRENFQFSISYWMGIFSPRFMPVLIIRLSRFCYLRSYLRPLSQVLAWLNVFLFGIECTPKCDIGSGLALPHTVGTVIGAFSIGKNATIFQGVSLGAEAMDFGFSEDLRPKIGEGVVMGAGAKIFGGIDIGDGARVAPNSLVIKTVPKNCLASGIPAKLTGKY